MPSEKKKTGASGGKKHASKRRGVASSVCAGAKGRGAAPKPSFLELNPERLAAETRTMHDMLDKGVHPKAAAKAVAYRQRRGPLPLRPSGTTG